MKKFLLLLLLWPSLLWAEQVVEQDQHRLHYMAMVTQDLTPDVARIYGITRSRKQGILILNLQHASAPQVSVVS